MNIRRARMRSAVTVALTSIFVAALCVAGGGIASATAEPTITLSGFPDSVIVDTAYTQFTLALHNPNAPVADTRIDVTITGTSDLQGSDVRLQYASELWSGAVLQGQRFYENRLVHAFGRAITPGVSRQPDRLLRSDFRLCDPRLEILGMDDSEKRNNEKEKRAIFHSENVKLKFQARMGLTTLPCTSVSR